MEHVTGRRALAGALALVTLTGLVAFRLLDDAANQPPPWRLRAGSSLDPSAGPSSAGATATTPDTAQSSAIPTDGILRIYGSNAAGMGSWSVPPGEVRSSSVAMLYNTGSSPLRITRAEPISVDHLRFVDVGFLPDDTPMFSGAKGFPQDPNYGGGARPARLPFELPGAGREIPIGPTGTFPLGTGLGTNMMAGYVLEDGQTLGHLEGIRLTYVVDGDEHQLDVPVEFYVCSWKCSPGDPPT